MHAIEIVTVYTNNIKLCTLPCLDAEILTLDDGPKELIKSAKNSDYIIIDGASSFVNAILDIISPVVQAHAIVSDTCASKMLVYQYFDNSSIKPNALLSILPFQNSTMILCPNESIDLKAIDPISKYWETKGYEIELMTAKECDSLVALADQAPVISAISGLDALDEFDPSVKLRFLQLHTNSQETFTGLDAVPISRFIEDLIDNKEDLEHILGEVINKMTALKKSIKRGDEAYIGEVLQRSMREYKVFKSYKK